MARVGFSTNRHTENFGTVAAFDPGPRWPAEHRRRRVRDGDVGQRQERGLLDPAALSDQRHGPVSLFAYGINVAGSLTARDGYGMPFFETVESADPCSPKSACCWSTRATAALPGVAALDLRGEKMFTFGSRELALSVDLFNVFNSSTVLGRQRT